MWRSWVSRLLCTVLIIRIGIFWRRSSEGTCVSRRSLQLTLAWFGWVGLLFSVGELNFDLFLTSSNKLTATVESNAATEKKNYHLCVAD